MDPICKRKNSLKGQHSLLKNNIGFQLGLRILITAFVTDYLTSLSLFSHLKIGGEGIIPIWQGHQEDWGGGGIHIPVYVYIYQAFGIKIWKLHQLNITKVNLSEFQLLCLQNRDNHNPHYTELL